MLGLFTAIISICFFSEKSLIILKIPVISTDPSYATFLSSADLKATRKSTIQFRGSASFRRYTGVVSTVICTSGWMSGCAAGSITTLPIQNVLSCKGEICILRRMVHFLRNDEPRRADTANGRKLVPDILQVQFVGRGQPQNRIVLRRQDLNRRSSGQSSGRETDSQFAAERASNSHHRSQREVVFSTHELRDECRRDSQLAGKIRAGKAQGLESFGDRLGEFENRHFFPKARIILSFREDVSEGISVHISELGCYRIWP